MNYEDRVTKEYIENALAAKCEVVTGTYVGNSSTKTVTLGFRPKAVLIAELDGTFQESAMMFMDGVTPYSFGGQSLWEVTDSGFIVRRIVYNGSLITPNVNSGNSTFMYVAMR